MRLFEADDKRGNGIAGGSAGQTSDRFNRRFTDRLLRGGRMTKVNGQAVSLAPSVGHATMGLTRALAPVAGRIAALLSSSVSGLALARAAATALLAVPAGLTLSGTAAYAGTCSPFGYGYGVYTCSGAAGAGGTDTTQVLAPAGYNDLTVTTVSGFGIDTTTTGGSALMLTVNAGAANLTFTDNYTSAISGAREGIDARNYGTGFTTITTTGQVRADAEEAISAYNSGTDLTINAQGSVIGYNEGIYARNYGSGTLSITTQAVSGGFRYGILPIMPAPT